MGKFLKLLESEMAMEWSEKYIDYRRLKDQQYALTPNIQHQEHLNAVRALALLRHQDGNHKQPNRWSAFQSVAKHSKESSESTQAPVLMRSMTPPRETYRSARLMQIHERSGGQTTANTTTTTTTTNTPNMVTDTSPSNTTEDIAVLPLPPLPSMYYDPALGIRKIPESVDSVLNIVSGKSNDDSALSSTMSTENQREKWKKEHEIVKQQKLVSSIQPGIPDVDAAQEHSTTAIFSQYYLNMKSDLPTPTGSNPAPMVHSSTTTSLTNLLPTNLNVWIQHIQNLDDSSTLGSDHLLDSIDGPEETDDEEEHVRPTQLQPVMVKPQYHAKPQSILLNSDDDEETEESESEASGMNDVIVDNSHTYAQNQLQRRLQQQQKYPPMSVTMSTNTSNSNSTTNSTNNIAEMARKHGSSSQTGYSPPAKGASPNIQGKRLNPQRSTLDALLQNSPSQNSSKSSPAASLKQAISVQQLDKSGCYQDDNSNIAVEPALSSTGSQAAMSMTGLSVATKKELAFNNLDAEKVEKLVDSLMSDTSGGRQRRESIVAAFDMAMRGTGSSSSNNTSNTIDDSTTHEPRRNNRLGSIVGPIQGDTTSNSSAGSLSQVTVQSYKLKPSSMALHLDAMAKEMREKEDVDSKELDDIVHQSETASDVLTNKLENLSRKAAGLPSLSQNPASVSRSLRGAKPGVSERTVDLGDEETFLPQANVSANMNTNNFAIDIHEDGLSDRSSNHSLSSAGSLMSMHSLQQISSFMNSKQKNRSRNNLGSSVNSSNPVGMNHSMGTPINSGFHSRVSFGGPQTPAGAAGAASNRAFFASSTPTPNNTTTLSQAMSSHNNNDHNVVTMDVVNKLFEDSQEETEDNGSKKSSIAPTVASTINTSYNSYRSRSMAMPPLYPKPAAKQNIVEGIDLNDEDQRHVQIEFPDEDDDQPVVDNFKHVTDDKEDRPLLNKPSNVFLQSVPEQVHEQYRDLSVYTVGRCQKGLYSSKRISSVFSRPITHAHLEGELPTVRPRDEIESEHAMLPTMDSLVPNCERRTLECVFFSAVQAQLDKINDFCITLEEYYSYHLQLCLDEAKKLEEERQQEHKILSPLLHRSRTSSLKSSLQELYRGLHLLESYQRLNLMGFVKIMAKHDELSPWFHRSQELCLPVVFSTHFAQSNAGELMLSQVEESYTKVFGKAKRDAMQHMLDSNFQMTPLLSLFVGFFLGIMLSIIVAIITLFVNYPTKSFGSPAFIDVFPIFSCLFQLCFHLWIYAIQTTICVSLRVNYVLCQQLTYNSFIRPLSAFLLAAVFTSLQLISFTVFCFSNTADADTGQQHLSVLVVFVIFILALICPFNVFARATRFYLLKKFLRLVGSPFTQATIQETFFGDHLTSLIRMIQDFSYSICYYCQAGDIVHESTSRAENCNTAIHDIVWIFGIMPHFFRLMQCFRLFAKSRKPFPFLFNALKYTISCQIALFSWLRSHHAENDNIRYIWITLAVVGTLYTSWWDVFVDWQLLNRHRIAREHYDKQVEELQENHTDKAFGLVNGEEDEDAEVDKQVLVRRSAGKNTNSKDVPEHQYSENASGDEDSVTRPQSAAQVHNSHNSIATYEEEDVLMKSSACVIWLSRCIGRIQYKLGLSQRKRAVITCMLPSDLLASFFTCNEHMYVYYLFAFLNTLLRVGWLTSIAPGLLFGLRREYLLTVMGLLEQVRRGIWSFLRLEAEHTKNMQAMHASNLEDLPKPATIEKNNYANASYGFPAGYAGVASMYETNNVMEGDGGFYVEATANTTDETNEKDHEDQIQDDIAHITPSTDNPGKATVEITPLQ